MRSDAAVATITRFSGGVPRTVCRLARLSAVAAAGEGLDRVAADTVERAWRELLPGDGDGEFTDHVERPRQPTVARVTPVRRLWG